jgi:hypothetical protein
LAAPTSAITACTSAREGVITHDFAWARSLNARKSISAGIAPPNVVRGAMPTAMTGSGAAGLGIGRIVFETLMQGTAQRDAARRRDGHPT